MYEYDYYAYKNYLHRVGNKDSYNSKKSDVLMLHIPFMKGHRILLRTLLSSNALWLAGPQIKTFPELTNYSLDISTNMF